MIIVCVAIALLTAIVTEFSYNSCVDYEAANNGRDQLRAEYLARSGIQLARLNTLYQLYADNSANFPPGTRWLNLPEYMLTRWGAAPFAEYTNATHCGLIELATRNWSPEIFAAAGVTETHDAEQEQDADEPEHRRRDQEQGQRRDPLARGRPCDSWPAA